MERFRAHRTRVWARRCREASDRERRSRAYTAEIYQNTSETRPHISVPTLGSLPMLYGLGHNQSSQQLPKLPTHRMDLALVVHQGRQFTYIL